MTSLVFQAIQTVIIGYLNGLDLDRNPVQVYPIKSDYNLVDNDTIYAFYFELRIEVGGMSVRHPECCLRYLRSAIR